MAKDKIIQTSKEYHNGKWQRVHFMEDKKGKVSIKPAKTKALNEKMGKKDGAFSNKVSCAHCGENHYTYKHKKK